MSEAAEAFKGMVKVFNNEFYIDLNTNEGVDKVLEYMDPILVRMAKRTYIPGYYFNDIKQELVILALQGLQNYDPSKGVALSTFLYSHLYKKLISRLKKENKLARNASIFKNDFDNSQKIRITKREIQFSQCSMVYEDGKETRFEELIPESDEIFNNRIARNEDMNFSLAVQKAIDTLDEKSRKLVKLICFDGMTKKDAGLEVGLSASAVSVRFDKMAGKPAIREILGKRAKR